ncbi:hypothetical protein GLYMA_08G234400v4 [Glycine max]|uniref:ubiquitin carboxyl-terminal hydrolase 15-like isoform X3 n=1 Tax=Glycine soja TaxID=3848 RepID=UPI00103FC50B|nr:ubiquitin carboxyl-terminal hydrolase 15-like isoform X3 [Glycine soja]XP_040874303.1 ubiquitin carboxyl-terminal hydrolase 15 isoform X3 [Glycine max]KAG4399453.1 hypothetical protein GLYMA_08G234400v4 [Glycine max]KAH1052725.1 hypothetical protein GYH30_022165 [Glycine max]
MPAYGVNMNEMNLNCVLMIILMIILPILGLLLWLENKLSNNFCESNHYSKWKELVQINDEINSLLFGQDGNTSSAHCACSFCGRLSDIVTRCSCCNTAIYCSNACHVMHWRFCHKYECVEIEMSEDLLESPSHRTHCLLMEPENKIYEGDAYYIEGGEEQNSVELSDETAMPRHGNINGINGCVVCGNPSCKACSRCIVIKSCSRTCQHFDWRSGHRFQCLVEKENSSEAALVNQARPAYGNVIFHCLVENHKNSNEVEDNAHLSIPLCLEFLSGNTNSRALNSSSLSQDATNNAREVEDQLRSLKKELAKIKDENITLRSECDEWGARARNSIDRLYSFKKENEHQLFILKQENELISNAEKQACQMINSLSQRLHCLQIAVESGVEERQKQEEYVHMLQNECTKAKIELQEQNKCIQRLALELDKTTQFVGCSICLTNEKNMTFGCGHMTCLECGSKIHKCHICRRKITIRIRLFSD